MIFRRDTVARANPQVNEPERDVAHSPDKLGSGDAHPFASALFADCVGFVLAEECRQTEAGQRRRGGYYGFLSFKPWTLITGLGCYHCRH